jgi:hypothetical protein
MYAPIPDTSPPPPIGNENSMYFFPALSEKFNPYGSLTSNNQWIIERWNKYKRILRGYSLALANAAEKSSPNNITSAPNFRTPSTFISGVVSGHHNSCLYFSLEAARATPCAWLPC